MERFGDGVENLVHLYGVFIYSALEFEDMGAFFSDFVYKQCILGFQMGELIDNTGMVVGQLYINASLHGHG